MEEFKNKVRSIAIGFMLILILFAILFFPYLTEMFRVWDNYVYKQMDNRERVDNAKSVEYFIDHSEIK